MTQRAIVASNDNKPAKSPLTKQVNFTPLLHLDGVGAFSSDDICEMTDHYVLKGRTPAPPGKVFKLRNDDGDDVWVAVIVERKKFYGNAWGLETYRTEGEAIASMYDSLIKEAA